jgi:hypothetical protein
MEFLRWIGGKPLGSEDLGHQYCLFRKKLLVFSEMTG